jgi:hypothetical protein
MITVGAKVKVTDGSYSSAIVNAEYVHLFGTELSPRTFTVLATNLSLPALDCTGYVNHEQVNDTIIKDVLSNNIIFIQERFLREIKSNHQELHQLDIPTYKAISKNEQGKALNLINFDTAIPQDWADNCEIKLGINPSPHVVWSYDKVKIWGEPVGITRQGVLIVEIMSHIAKKGWKGES